MKIFFEAVCWIVPIAYVVMNMVGLIMCIRDKHKGGKDQNPLNSWDEMGDLM